MCPLQHTCGNVSSQPITLALFRRGSRLSLSHIDYNRSRPTFGLSAACPVEVFFFLLEVLIGVRFASDTILRYQKLAFPIDVLLRYFTLAPIDLSHARNVRFARCVQSLEAGCRASSFIYFSTLTCDCGETSLVQLPSISTTVACQSKPLSLLLRYLMIIYCCITIETLT
jgi:hypothetical protein